MIICGAMSFTFMKARGEQIGKSLVELDYVELARNFYEKYKDKIILPFDFKAAPEFKDVKPVIVEGNIPDDLMALDVASKSIKAFTQAIQGAKTVV